MASLVLHFSKSPGKTEAVNIGNLSFPEARRFFEKAYFSYLLVRSGCRRDVAAKMAGLHRGSLRWHITHCGVQKEFPVPPPRPPGYEFTFSFGPAQSIQFRGTLPELEERYVLTHLVRAEGDRKKVVAALSSGPRDPHLGRVFKRLARAQNINFLIESVRENPVCFQGTLAELRRHFIMQVLYETGKNKEMVLPRLGMKKGALNLALRRYCLARTRPKGEEAGKDSSMAAG